MQKNRISKDYVKKGTEAQILLTNETVNPRGKGLLSVLCPAEP
jgi:hypothetical protein